MASELKQRRGAPPAAASAKAQADAPTPEPTAAGATASAAEAAPASSEASPPSAAAATRWRWFVGRKPDFMVFLVVGLSLACLVGLRFIAESGKNKKPRLFDENTLALYNGEKNSPLYLAILGEVFDVTKGRKHYDPSKGYGFFLGKDASRAFVTGEFKSDLTDDVRGLEPEQYKSLIEWRSFYRKTYPFKGRLIGRFYNTRGQAKKILKALEAEAAKAKSFEEKQREMEATLPSCNVRWTQAEGGEVWCDNGMYPRKVFLQLPGGKPTTKCACFEELGWSDLRQVYADCPPDAHACKTPK